MGGLLLWAQYVAGQYGACACSAGVKVACAQK
jgi:hypothetical protein